MLEERCDLFRTTVVQQNETLTFLLTYTVHIGSILHYFVTIAKEINYYF